MLLPLPTLLLPFFLSSFIFSYFFPSFSFKVFSLSFLPIQQYYCIKLGLHLFLKNMISREESYLIMFFQSCSWKLFHWNYIKFKTPCRDLFRKPPVILKIPSEIVCSWTDDSELLHTHLCTVCTRVLLVCCFQRDKRGWGRLGLLLCPFSWWVLLRVCHCCCVRARN